MRGTCRSINHFPAKLESLKNPLNANYSHISRRPPFQTTKIIFQKVRALLFVPLSFRIKIVPLAMQYSQYFFFSFPFYFPLLLCAGARSANHLASTKASSNERHHNAGEHTQKKGCTVMRKLLTSVLFVVEDLPFSWHFDAEKVVWKKNSINRDDEENKIDVKQFGSLPGQKRHFFIPFSSHSNPPPPSF